MEIIVSDAKVPNLRGGRGILPEGAVYVGPAHIAGRGACRRANGPTRSGKGRAGTRDTIVAKYRTWIVRQPDLMAALHEPRDKDLACWCAPKRCHAGLARPRERLISAVGRHPGQDFGIARIARSDVMPAGSRPLSMIRSSSATKRSTCFWSGFRPIKSNAGRYSADL